MYQPFYSQVMLLPRSRFQIVAFALLPLLLSAQAKKGATQNAKPADAEAQVTAARVSFDNGIPVVEVDSTQPLTPTIQMLDSPPRLVIDLPRAHMSMQRRRIPVQKENILTLRAEQYQIEPAMARIVVDMLVPCAYTWDAAGNRLMVRLKAAEEATAHPDKAPAPESAAMVSAAEGPFVPLANGSGDFSLSGKAFADGSSLTAGSDTTILRLSRGGEVRVCPGTTVSVTPAKGSKNLMLGMSTGALEMHYSLKETADTVLTPDFRILFAGPGEFDYAVSADAHGNTCVRGLKGNSASAIVYELMGDRIYQVKPSEQLVFHSGRIDQVDGDVPTECGCPPPAPAKATDVAQSAPMGSQTPSKVMLANSAGPNSSGASSAGNADTKGQTLSGGSETRELPPSQPSDVHVEVEAPLVFHGKPKGATATAPPPMPIEEAAALPVMQSSGASVRLNPQVQAPPPATAAQPAPKQHRGFMQRIKGFFGSIFH